MTYQTTSWVVCRVCANHHLYIESRWLTFAAAALRCQALNLQAGLDLVRAGVDIEAFAELPYQVWNEDELIDLSETLVV